MLDDEPNNSNESNTSGELPVTGADTDAGPAPAKKAARKAAAKRAPRKATKKAADPVPELAAQPTAAPAANSSDGPSGESTDAPKKAKKSTARKAPVKKAAPAVQFGSSADSAAADGATSGTAASSAAASDEAAPAKKAPRKRAAKKAAAPAAESASNDGAASDADRSAPALAPPVVLFQPPSEAAPTTRRRRSAAQSAEPTLDETGTVGTDSPAEADNKQPSRTSGRGRGANKAATQTDDSAETSADGSDTDSDDSGDGSETGGRKRRRRGRRGRGAKSNDVASENTEDGSTDDSEDETDVEGDHADEVAEAALSASARRRRRRRRAGGGDGADGAEDDPPNTVVHVRDGRSSGGSSGGGSSEGRSSGGRGGDADSDGVRGVKGSTRLEAKRQRRRDNRDSGRRRAPILTEAEFLARREAVERVMAVRQTGDRTQIAVLEDDILVEHYVTRASSASAVGNVYLGRVQNVLPSMEAAFVDIGRGRNGVLYAGEVNWDAAGLEGKSRAIENALNPGDAVLVQVTKDPIGHKGARLTSQVSLPGRFLVYVPGGGMTGISRKLPDTERSRLKSILKKVVPEDAGVIVRTAAEGASEADLISDVERLKAQWESITAKAEKKTDAPVTVYGEPDLAIRVVRDVFNDDFSKLVVAGSGSHATITDYVSDVAPDLAERISLHTGESDLFHDLRVDEQLAKALDRKVWLPSGGSLVIDRTEAMVVIDVNTGKYTGSGGNLEQTVTRNNLEAAEEIVRQLRLRDVGGIIVIDFIDMVLESNRDLVLRRLTECLGRDRTKHQVAEVTSLGLVQMTRKRVGEGLLEAFSEQCSVCNGRGVILHTEPVDKKTSSSNGAEEERPSRNKRGRKSKAASNDSQPADVEVTAAEIERRRVAASAIAAIAAATNHHDELVDSIAAEAIEGIDAPPTLSIDQPIDQPIEQSDDASTNRGTRSRGARGSRGNLGKAAASASADEAAGTVAAAPPAAPEPDVAAATQPPARPRRRRAASRPAGPPATSTDPSVAANG